MAAKKTRVKKASIDKKAAPRVAATTNTPARNFDRSLWRRMNGQEGAFQGLQVWHPMDPYSGLQRKEFRSAMTNPYVYRASRIHTTFTTGQGYTTEIVPRQEEDVPEEQLNDWQRTQTYHVPYFDKEMTAEQIKDKVDILSDCVQDQVDKICNDIDDLFIELENNFTLSSDTTFTFP